MSFFMASICYNAS